MWGEKFNLQVQVCYVIENESFIISHVIENESFITSHVIENENIQEKLKVGLIELKT